MDSHFRLGRSELLSGVPEALSRVAVSFSDEAIQCMRLREEYGGLHVTQIQSVSLGVSLNESGKPAKVRV